MLKDPLQSNTLNKIVAVHSFRRGVGKTNLAANLAALLALQGKRVALVDRNFQAPSAHLFFGLNDDESQLTFNGYLSNKCDILSTAQDVTAKLGPEARGKLFIVTASTQVSEIMHLLRNSLDIDHYTNGLQKLVTELSLDILLVDTLAGLSEDTMPSIAMSNTLIVILNPDKEDFQGTAVIVDVARSLEIPKILIVLNNFPEALGVESVHSQLEQTYQCGRGIVLPHTDQLMALASSNLFVLSHPQALLTTRLKELAEQL